MHGLTTASLPMPEVMGQTTRNLQNIVERLRSSLDLVEIFYTVPDCVLKYRPPSGVQHAL